MIETSSPRPRGALGVRLSTIAGLSKSLGASDGLPDGLQVLAKSLKGSALKGAKRVGGKGASHKGSHWEHAQGDTVTVSLAHHGERAAVVIAKQKNQTKAFVPGLGMFAVGPESVGASGEVLPWDREHAEATVPVVGSLVNVKRPGDAQAKIMRLEEPLPDARSDDPAMPVRVSHGTIGRKQTELTVERQHILGPHVPRLLKNAEGKFVRDTAHRVTETGTGLDAVRTQASKWRRRSALDWIHSLKAGRASEISAEEQAWFKANQDRVISMAAKQAKSAGVFDPNGIDDIISEAFYGSLSGLRLWAKRPAKSRRWVAGRLVASTVRARRKKGEAVDPMAVALEVAGLTDDQLKMQRVMWRAWAKARAASRMVALGHLAGERVPGKAARMVKVDDDAARRARELAAFASENDDARAIRFAADTDDEAESVAGAFTVRSGSDDDDDEHEDEEPPPMLSTASVGPNRRLQLEHLADHIGNRIASAARLSDAEKYVLHEAMANEWENHDDGMSASLHTPIPAADAERVSEHLEDHFGVAVRASDIPRVWSHVKRRLRDAARDNPHLLVPLLGMPKETGRERELTRVVGDEVAELLDDPDALEDGLEDARASHATPAAVQGVVQGSMFDVGDDGTWDTAPLETANRTRAARSGNLGPVLRKSFGGGGLSRTAAICAAFTEHRAR